MDDPTMMSGLVADNQLDIDSLPPEVLAQLVELGVLDDQAATVQDELDYARMLRDREGTQGVTAGRAYAAASPLSHIADAVRGYKANKAMGTAEEEMDAIRAKQTEGRAQMAQIIEGLRRGRTDTAPRVGRQPSMADRMYPNLPRDQI